MFAAALTNGILKFWQFSCRSGWRALAKCCQHADVGVEASRRSREHSRTGTASGICNDVEQITMTVPWTGSFSWNIAGYLAEYQSFH